MLVYCIRMLVILHSLLSILVVGPGDSSWLYTRCPESALGCATVAGDLGDFFRGARG